MAQGVLPYQYVEDPQSNGATGLAGLPAYLDLAAAAGLRAAVGRLVGARPEESQGWSDAQVVLPLVLLNLAGGTAVEDIELLEADEGFCEVVRRTETHGLPRQQRRALERRLRKGRERTLPSPSAVFRYLEAFHDEEQEALRPERGAFIPAPNEHLQGLVKLGGELAAFAQKQSPQRVATLDMDATLVETHKRNALFCYKGFQAYQPLNTYWAERGLVLHSEFRDGNVPAGYEHLRVTQEALELVPDGVEKVYLRTDTAGYQIDLLRYCAEGRNERFGVIDFAIGADVTDAFKAAVAQVPKADWQPIRRLVKGQWKDTGQQWAEVCYVPEWAGYSKNTPDYRFVAIRDPLQQLEIPGVEPQHNLPFPTMDFDEVGRHKLFGVVTNRSVDDIDGEELIRWHRQRCGKSEEVHAVMKDDFAGGQMPSWLFGVNAAWWQIMLLALNLDVIMKRIVLGGTWATRRMKAMRFAFIRVAGWVRKRARQLDIRLSYGHPSIRLLMRARRRIACMATGPPR